MEENIVILKKNPLFKGLTELEILNSMHCMNAKIISRSKGEYLFRTGDVTSEMGIIVSGNALVIQDDIWGNRNILNKLMPADSCVESFAFGGEPMNISILAESDLNVLMINVGRLLTVCSNGCKFHNRIICNLVAIMSGKMIDYSNKIIHMSKRTTGEKILSYLSCQSQKNNSLTFDIPYDRQELADYLGVDRAAMSAVLSKLQREGKIKYNKNHFELISGIESKN